jgi:hypothetical protein
MIILVMVHLNLRMPYDHFSGGRIQRGVYTELKRTPSASESYVAILFRLKGLKHTSLWQTGI